jgi:hypothetical protein
LLSSEQFLPLGIGADDFFDGRGIIHGGFGDKIGIDGNRRDAGVLAAPGEGQDDCRQQENKTLFHSQDMYKAQLTRLQTGTKGRQPNIFLYPLKRL